MSTYPSPVFQNVTAEAVVTDSPVTTGGTVDGTVIGGTTPEEATFTNVNTTTLNGGNYVASLVQGANVTVDNTDPRNPVISTVAGIPDAPSDGNIYGRQDEAWVVAATSSPLANPMTTPGDMIYGITAGNPSRLAIGSGGQVLTVVDGLPSWQTSAALVNPMTAVGDVIIGSTAGAPIRLGLGASGKVLLSNGTTVVWGNTPTPITTAGDLIVGGSGGAPTRLGIGVNGTVLGVSGGVLSYVAPGAGGQSLVVINPQTGSYTLALSDFPTNGNIVDIQITSSSAQSVTIPPNSSVAAPIGSQIIMSAWGTGAVTFVAGTGVTFVDAWGVATTAQFDSRYARQVATDIWQIL